MKKFGAAIIGCGAIHKLHADAISNSPHSTLIAVCDIDAEKAKAAASQYGSHYYTDYMEMLENKEIDVVHICTPHYLHAPMAIDAMRKGKHVLTEKPIAINLDDAGEMIRVSGETARTLGVCFQNRYNTTSIKIKEMLMSGKSGRILGIRAFVTWHRDEKYYASGDWRGSWEKEGGGVLINQSIHTLDLVQWFMGDIDRIKGSWDIRLLKGCIEVEDTAEATIIFKNGATGLFYATNCYAADAPVEIEIVCENMLLRLSGDLTVKYKDKEAEHFHDVDSKTGGKSYWGCGHAALIEDYYSKLLNGEKFCIGGREAITALKMIHAIYESSRTGEYIKF